MGIESDVINADSRLSVKFHSQPVKNEFLTQKEGRPIFEDRDMITIYVPGDNTLTVVAEVRDDHKQRFPLQWAHYQNKHADDPKNIGTPIGEWPLVTPAMAEELRALKFYTVESIAMASDGQLQSIGMRAGMNPMTFRDRARNYLDVAQKEANLSGRDLEIKRLIEENASIKSNTDAKILEMQDQMAQLLAAINAKPAARKGGRPSKTPSQG